ncbi:hypothetical protein V5O48_014439 [Marasmius crinis-equi]|uniref:AAA-ATPase-like domain-containing protein n=1 Tax=Marasmius crinis-equi TaxID=585013 RepID=A0ABR3EXB0_9AGAR
MNHCQDVILPKVLWRGTGTPRRADFWSLVDAREDAWSLLESRTDSPMPPDSRLDSPMWADSPSSPTPWPGTPKHAQSSLSPSHEVSGRPPSSTSSFSSASSLPLTRLEPYASTNVKFGPSVALTGKWNEEETFEDEDWKLGRHGFEISPPKHPVTDDMDTSVESFLPAVSFEESVQARLEQLRSQTTDFEEIRHFHHYCDRTSILEATIKHPCVLLKAPPGYGKTTALSMIEQFYDILQKDNFRRIFKGTAIECHLILHEECDHHSRSLVLKLDFGNLDLLRTDFNMNAEINRMLEDFVDRYRSSIPRLSDSARSEFVDEESAAETLRKLMLNLEPGSKLVVCIDN